MQKRLDFRLPARQQGATLIMALLILVLIMIIGITAVSTSNTQFKLAGNLQFEDAAMNNAEAAVASAENWVASGTNYAHAAMTGIDPATDPDPESEPGTPQLLPRTSVAAIRAARINRPFSMSWDSDDSVNVGGNTAQRYYIELMSTNNKMQGSNQGVGGRSSSGCNQVNTYLITARGVSARGANRLVQSFFSVLSCPA